ncbi:MFS transporter [Dyella nitratireducens]|uniref:MFS sugar transporter n=1 Tax=Dyella nitratireducens TaxID=1849580 RepID=A0ABQ1FLB4_9GAMM|nr:MFS transporter [Dyella nitratireducens]GGA21079.1 MFS sugar transporter [Dyella nitratireducens]GLQ44289.1 MFS sugar transporter [Dyella nitratireducens]
MQLVYRHFIWRYALAHYGKSLFWYTSELLFPFYLTEIGLFSGWAMGLVIGASLVFSVLADLVVGWLGRRCLSSARRAGQCQIIGASLSVISILSFFACVWTPSAERVAYALVALLCFRFTYALYDIAQDVLVNLATNGRNQRSHLTGVHFSFSGIASITVATLVTPMVAMHDGKAHSGFFMLAALLSVGALASSLQLGRYLRWSDAARSEPARVSSPHQDTTPPMFYFVMTFLLSLCGPMFAKVAPYYGAYAMHHRFAGTIMISLYSLGVVLAFPLFASLVHRMHRMLIMVRAALCMVAVSIVIMSAAQLDAYVLYGAAFALGISWGMLGILCWSGFADAVSRKQTRAVSFDYAQFLASAKAGLLLAVILIGATLSSLDYKSTQAQDLLPLMATPSIVAGVALLLMCWNRRLATRATGSIGMAHHQARLVNASYDS